MKEAGRILLADDHQPFRVSTADMLRRAGYTCDEASDGKLAAQMLQEAAYDVLIADIIMNGNDDLQLVKEAPRIAEGLSIVIVTGHPTVKTAVEAIHEQIDAYLVKPFEEKDLLEAVGRSLQRARTRRAIRESRDHLAAWSGELTKLLESSVPADRTARPLPVEAFIGLTFRNIITAVSGLQMVMESLVRQGIRPPIEACRLFECPRLDKLTNATVETVDVLLATRNSFKSVVLADHRKRLQDMLREMGIGPYGKNAPPPEDAA
jgi:FixJ family two-component response regulator